MKRLIAMSKKEIIRVIYKINNNIGKSSNIKLFEVRITDLGMQSLTLVEIPKL